LRRRLGGLCAIAVEHSHDRVHFHGLALFVLNVCERASRGRRNLGVDLIGRDFEQRLITFDVVANVLQPFCDGAFRDGFAHLRHYYFSRHGI
jgi:hypothetical protein